MRITDCKGDNGEPVAWIIYGMSKTTGEYTGGIWAVFDHAQNFHLTTIH